MLHESILESLISRSERLPQALLLYGPRGIGKLELARALAQRLLCEAEPAGVQACGRCNACRWFLAGNHPDFRQVEPEASAQQRPTDEAGDAESEAGKPGRASREIKIAQIRELADFLNIGSHRGARRVALLHPAEDMNMAAANALLKGLEDSPPSVVFLLVSHRPARLLPTIRSRCVRLPVPVPPEAEARAWLAEQGVAEAGQWLAFAGGAPGQALEFSAGETAEPIAKLRSALEKEDFEALAGVVQGRTEMELLVDLLQRHAVDRALLAVGDEPRFGTAKKSRGPERPWPWIDFSRRLGRYRPLSRHPLNAGLFAWEVVEEFRDCLAAARQG